MLEYHVKRAEIRNEPAEYVLSDGKPDRMDDVIEPAGWQLGKFAPAALFNHNRDAVIGKWEGVRVEDGELKGRLVLAERGTSPIVDSVRALIEQGMLDAVSVGFRALEKEPRKRKNAGGVLEEMFGPFRFTKTELLEASLVSVAANPRARRIVKQFLSDEESSRLFAERGENGGALPRRPPASKPKPTLPRVSAMSTIAERITAKQSEIVAINDKLSEIKKRIEASNIDPSEDDGAEIEALNGELNGANAALTRLKGLEQGLAARVTAPAIVRPEAVLARKSKGWDLLLRNAVVKYCSHVEQKPVDYVMAQRYPEDRELELFVKTTTAPAMTSVVGWAAELVTETLGAYMETLRPVSVFPSLAAAGVSLTFDGLAPIRIPYRKYGTGTPPPNGIVDAANNRRLSGAFVGEGAPIPVRQGLLTSLTLSPYKMAVISVFTREMAQSSTPAIESIIRDAMIEDTAWTLDLSVFSDEAAIAGVRPAGLYNGLTPLTPAAAGAGAALTDIKALVDAITAVGGGRNLVWIMNPAQALALDLTTESGVFIFSQIQANVMRNRIVSLTQPAGEVTLIDAADFVSAGNVPSFDVSDQATLHMDDGTYPAPANAPTVKPIVGGTGTAVIGDVASPVRSLWQTASIGVRMIMPISWGMRRPGMIAFMQSVNW